MLLVVYATIFDWKVPAVKVMSELKAAVPEATVTSPLPGSNFVATLN